LHLCLACHLGSFERGPLLWLTKYTKTEDPHWLEKGSDAVTHFPRKPYFPHVLHYLISDKLVFIPKTREMMTSWLVMGYIASEAQWFEQVQWVVQSQKETKSFELVDHARQLYRYQEPWMRARVKIVEDSAGHIRLSNGSEIIGIPAGESQIRSYHPTGYLMDEASHLPEARAMLRRGTASSAQDHWNFERRPRVVGPGMRFVSSG